MNLWERLTGRTPAPHKAPTPAAGFTTSGRPTYALGTPGISGVLPRHISFELLRQYYRSIPLLGRSIDILAGFTGVPTFLIDGNETASEELNQWAKQVPFGHIGSGLKAWAYDHLAQTLIYGYGVAEVELGTQRDGVNRLWSYVSPQFGFRTDDTGAIEVVQQQQGRGLVTLNPETTILSTHRPEGCDPNGSSLFFASGTFCQAWLDLVYAYRATTRRSGIPIYHVHVEMPATLDDPDGTITEAVRDAYEGAWNEGIRSQVQDGLAKDFITVGVGTTTINTVGTDTAVDNLEIGKRAIVEEIVTATGIPPFMLGLHWSTTERLSSEQADILLATVDILRGMLEPGIRKIVNLRQRLELKRDGLEVQLVWPDVNLKDATESAKAAYNDAQAMKVRLSVGERLWQVGIWDQAMVAEHVTGDPNVVTVMAEPPVPMVEEPQDNAPRDPEDERAAQEATLKELWAAYAPGAFKATCNGHGPTPREFSVL